MFYNVEDYPEIAELAERIDGQFRAIERWMDVVYGDMLMWPEPIHNGLWFVHPLKWQGEIKDEAFNWLHMPGIVNAGFSWLMPGAWIEPHRGYTGDVVRLHYGIRCPPGDCAIRVGPALRSRQWHDRKFMLFDDTEEHEAWNNTTKARAILLLDLDRKAFGIPYA